MVQGRSDEVLKWLSIRSLSDSAGWALPKNIAEACGISEEDAKKAVHKFLAKKVGLEAPEITPHEIAGNVKSIFVRFGKNEDTAELAVAGA